MTSFVPLLLIWTALIGKLAFLLLCLVFSFMLLTIDALRHTHEFIGQGASSAGAFQYLLTSLCNLGLVREKSNRSARVVGKTGYKTRRIM